MADFFGTQGSDTIPGTDVDDYIRGWARIGNASTDLGDQLSRLGGNDYVTGGGGNDYLSGGDGHDLLEGGNGRDRLFGGDGRDGLLGEAGDDDLYGEAGDDSLESGDGADSVAGGADNDSLPRDARLYQDWVLVLDIDQSAEWIATVLTEEVTGALVVDCPTPRRSRICSLR